ncbi:diguanylate cyclase domain-containing protein, partial [Kineosporia sp. R_H_3]|uniref:sensor domain-containing diguanylate cyclase n=1 Tax=Kineosporia sp. R_H_3 TaxID=1961848 RepID=UPI00117B8208
APEPVAVEPEPAVDPEPAPLPAPHPFAGELAHPDATHAVPHPRGHRQPSPRQRQVLREASLRFEHPTDRFGIAQVATEEALALVEADIASLVVRSVEGPRVLRQDPEGMGIWGAKTLAALMNLGRPLRKVIEGDPLSGGGQTALLVVPVPAAGTVAGTLVVRRTTGRAFSPAEQDCLERLARMAGAALDTAARRGMLVGQGRLDPVTGLAHRDRLVEDLRAALLTSQTHGMPTSLLAAEVTGLAELREAEGRPAADEAVAALAAALTGTLRVGDVPYRFGLDEFAVLLPATQEEDAPSAAARLGAAIDALDLRPGGRRLRLRTAVVPVTGVAEDVVLRAIRALAAAERPSVEA